MTTPAARALAHVRSLSSAAGPPGLFDRARITVNFHPDRLLADGRTVAEHLVADGRYRNQFETRISNGGLNAYPGGDRDRWEHRMFGGAYTATITGRPVYGGLNLAGHVDGASPRFGSCYLVLDPAVAARATFSHGDSVTEPVVLGTADTFGSVWAALLDEVARTGKALGLAADGPQAWVAALSVPRPAAGRAMDDYVEAQIHGGVDLGADVTAVVADPSFSGTATAAHLASLTADLRWHPGFVLGPGAYRTDRIDAALIGRAAREPATWSRFGTPADVLQQLKYLWHILVLLGRPA
jgi:hypothetical protein